MSVNPIGYSIKQYIPSTDQVVGKFSTLLPKISRNLTKIAIPIIVMVAISQMPTAEAGPLAYASCMAGCTAMGIFAPVCWPACIPVLAIPGP